MEVALESWGSGYESACAGKPPYPTESAAIAGLAFLQKEGLYRTGNGTVPYKCRYCLEWHLGR